MNRTRLISKSVTLLTVLMICVSLVGALPVSALTGGNGNVGQVGDNGNMNGDGGVLNDVGNGIRNGVEDVGNGIREGAEDIGSGVRDGVDDVRDGVGDVARGETRNMGIVRDADGFIANDGTAENVRDDDAPFNWAGLLIGLSVAAAVVIAVVLLVPKKRSESANTSSGNMNRR